MTVFRAFCDSFERTAKQFTSGLEHSFAEHFSNSFIDLWRQTPSNLRFATAPTYSSVAAGRTESQPPGSQAPTAAAAPLQQRPQQPISRFQGRPIPAPPREDLRVFVRPVLPLAPPYLIIAKCVFTTPVASAFARKPIASFMLCSYTRTVVRTTMSSARSPSPVSPIPQSLASYLPAASTGTTPEATSDDASQCEFDIDWENIWHGGKRLVGAKKRVCHRRVVGTKIKESWIYRHGANLEHKGIRYWLCKLCHEKRSYSTALYASSGTAHAARHLLRHY